MNSLVLVRSNSQVYRRIDGRLASSKSPDLIFWFSFPVQKSSCCTSTALCHWPRPNIFYWWTKDCWKNSHKIAEEFSQEVQWLQKICFLWYLSLNSPLHLPKVLDDMRANSSVSLLRRKLSFRTNTYITANQRTLMRAVKIIQRCGWYLCRRVHVGVGLCYCARKSLLHSGFNVSW